MIQCGHFTVILVYFLGHPVIEKIDTLIIAMVFPSSSKPCWDKATNPASMIIWLRCPPKWPIIRVKTRAAISSRWHEPNCNHINLYHLTNISKSVYVGATNKLQHCNCLMSDLGTGFIWNCTWRLYLTSSDLWCIKQCHTDTQCLKIIQSVWFGFSNFGIFHQFLSF